MPKKGFGCSVTHLKWLVQPRGVAGPTDAVQRLPLHFVQWSRFATLSRRAFPTGEARQRTFPSVIARMHTAGRRPCVRQSNLITGPSKPDVAQQGTSNLVIYAVPTLSRMNWSR